MKLDDIDAADKLRTKIKNCDFHLGSLSEFTIRLWNGDRGGIVEAYGDRHEYLDEAATKAVYDIVKSSLTAKRSGYADQLRAMGFDVPEATP